MIDTHVYLSRWPFRRLPGDETLALVARLRENGVVQAWMGSFEALLHRDVTGVNARLTADCRDHGDDLLIPFGTINPTLPGWQDDLKRCVAEHDMPGIRLHPNYHGYHLDEAVFAEFLDRAGESRLIVQLVVRMEDDRTQHPFVRVPATDLAPLAELLATRPELRVVLSSALRSPSDATLAKLTKSQAYFDIATLEGISALQRLLKIMPHERLLLGSMFPLFYLESAVLKLRESEIGHAAEEAITRGNAARLLHSRSPAS
ncbi:MAG: amidohydrolase family protein [Planctomycetaceae bacterium]